jgi:hypothetical protein
MDFYHPTDSEFNKNRVCCEILDAAKAGHPAKVKELLKNNPRLISGKEKNGMKGMGPLTSARSQSFQGFLNIYYLQQKAVCDIGHAKK